MDFVGGKLGYSLRVLGALLLWKAVAGRGGVRRVVDATAGLGRDAFLLACKGCEVTGVERSPIIAALLDDGLRRALADDRVGRVIGDRLRFIHADARHYLRALGPGDAPDVVYMDPMFPERAKSALVKKESQALRGVVGADDDAAELLAAARAVALRHVVVKRPRHAPPLAPDVTRACEGKSTRFDVYACG